MKPSDWRYQRDRVRHGLLRRRWRRRIERLYGEIVGPWDQEAFRRRMSRHWNPFAGAEAAKFLDVSTWLREAVFRYLLIFEKLAPQETKPRRVLDLGAGTGYFLLVCRHHGHDVLGLDLGDEPLYDDCFDFFGLPRLTHRIQPRAPLPELPNQLDVITALMTCFDRDEHGRPWDIEPWRFLLSDLRDRLTDGGCLCLKFNLNPHTGRYYDANLARLLRRGVPGLTGRMFFDYAVLRKLDGR